jgi:hypothetical protein
MCEVSILDIFTGLKSNRLQNETTQELDDDGPSDP